MSLQGLKVFCFTVCVLCIIVATLLAMAMIWEKVPSSDAVRKTWLTVCTFFLASALTLAVSKSVGEGNPA